MNFAATEPTPDAELRIECVFDDIRDSEVPSLGSGCDPTLVTACATTAAELELLRARLGRADAALYCEPSTRLCELRCTADSECPLGFRCAPSAIMEGAETGYCTDPRCD